jgi:hypothetical protein
MIQEGGGQERIVPLCYSCNNRSDALHLRMGVVLVGTNKAKTCKNNRSKARNYQVKPRAALTAGK